MTSLNRQEIAEINDSGHFNRWAGFSVRIAEAGKCVLEMPWREECGQYSGSLHAGVIAALLDTSCGFAAASMLGAVTTSQISICYLVPAIGKRFRAESNVVRGGRRQVFAEARLIAENDDTEAIVATATAVLIRLPETSPPAP